MEFSPPSCTSFLLGPGIVLSTPFTNTPTQPKVKWTQLLLTHKMRNGATFPSPSKIHIFVHV